jgi:acyl carrier protein
MLETKLIAYVSDRAGVPRDRLDLDTPLFTGNVLDSLAVMELVAFVEAETGLRFADTDIVPENLDSVRRILAYVAARKG